MPPHTLQHGTMHLSTWTHNCCFIWCWLAATRAPKMCSGPQERVPNLHSAYTIGRNAQCFTLIWDLPWGLGPPKNTSFTRHVHANDSIHPPRHTKFKDTLASFHKTSMLISSLTCQWMQKKNHAFGIHTYIYIHTYVLENGEVGSHWPMGNTLNTLNNF